MASSYNRVILMGRLTRDPQPGTLPSGTAVCELGLAANRRWRDRDTGHPGGVATVHANSTADALHRLEDLAGEASATVPRLAIASAANVVAFIERRPGVPGAGCARSRGSRASAATGTGGRGPDRPWTDRTPGRSPDATGGTRAAPCPHQPRSPTPRIPPIAV